MRVNNWEIYAFKLFRELYYNLVDEVTRLAGNEPEIYKQHPKSKLLKSINDAMLKDVPADPTHKDFNLGKTLGEKYKHWKRVKKRMPLRYRMFFRYHSDFITGKQESLDGSGRLTEMSALISEKRGLKKTLILQT
jgi:toxin YhaV